MKLIVRIAFISLFVSLGWSANSIQKSTLETIGNEQVFTLQFSELVPKYTSTVKAMEKMQALILDFPDCTPAELPELQPFPPVYHIEIHPLDNSTTTRVTIYTSSQAEGQQKQDQKKFTINFISTDKTPTSSPSQLTEFSYRMNDENNFSLRLDFDEAPSDPISFLTLDKKTAIVYLPNTGVSDGTVKDVETPLIVASKVDGGVTNSGSPYLKIALKSEQELLADLAKDPQRLFLDVYGMQTPQSNYLSGQDSTSGDEEFILKINKQSEATEGSGNKWAKWVYTGIGGVAIIGAGVAGYLYWKSQDGSTSNDIAEPDCSVFPSSTCDPKPTP